MYLGYLGQYPVVSPPGSPPGALSRVAAAADGGHPVSFSLFLYDSMLSHSIDPRYVQGVSWSNGGGQERSIVCLDEEQV